MEGGEWSASRRGRFIRGKERPVSIGQETGLDPEPIWTGRCEEEKYLLSLSAIEL
jgi:hypothetical protein